MKSIVLTAICVAMAGCATSAPPPHLTEGRFVVTLDAPPGIFTEAELQGQVVRTAQDYCAARQQGRAAVPAAADAAKWQPGPNQMVFRCTAADGSPS